MITFHIVSFAKIYEVYLQVERFTEVRVRGKGLSNKQQSPRHGKCQIFYTDGNFSQNFYPKNA